MRRRRQREDGQAGAALAIPWEAAAVVYCAERDQFRDLADRMAVALRLVHDRTSCPVPPVACPIVALLAEHARMEGR